MHNVKHYKTTTSVTEKKFHSRLSAGTTICIGYKIIQFGQK